MWEHRAPRSDSAAMTVQPASDNSTITTAALACPTSRNSPGQLMRFSGAVMFLGDKHLFIMLMWDNGVYRLDNFVAQRWASPFWHRSTSCCGWQLHGGNGLPAIIIDDYS